MRTLQELALRLAAHDVGAFGGEQLVGRVGLSTLELLDRQRAAKALDIRRHPARERRLVETMALAHRRGAQVGIGSPGHDGRAPAWSSLIFLASDHLWTSVGPS